MPSILPKWELRFWITTFLLCGAHLLLLAAGDSRILPLDQLTAPTTTTKPSIAKLTIITPSSVIADQSESLLVPNDDGSQRDDDGISVSHSVSVVSVKYSSSDDEKLSGQTVPQSVDSGNTRTNNRQESTSAVQQEPTTSSYQEEEVVQKKVITDKSSRGPKSIASIRLEPESQNSTVVVGGQHIIIHLSAAKNQNYSVKTSTSTSTSTSNIATSTTTTKRASSTTKSTPSTPTSTTVSTTSTASVKGSRKGTSTSTSPPISTASTPLSTASTSTSTPKSTTSTPKSTTNTPKSTTSTPKSTTSTPKSTTSTPKSTTSASKSTTSTSNDKGSRERMRYEYVTEPPEIESEESTTNTNLQVKIEKLDDFDKHEDYEEDDSVPRVVDRRHFDTSSSYQMQSSETAQALDELGYSYDGYVDDSDLLGDDSNDEVIPAYHDDYQEEDKPSVLESNHRYDHDEYVQEDENLNGDPERRKKTVPPLHTVDAATVVGITIGAFLFILIGSVGLGAFLYHEKYVNKPQTLDDRYANSDSGGYSVEDSFRRISHVECVGFEIPRDTYSEEMYNLDNDSFLNSLETVNIPTTFWSVSTDTRHSSDSDV